MAYELGQIRTDRGLFIDKDNEVTSVLHPDFEGGADPLGLKDSTAAFTSALTFATGKRVIVPAGDYAITGLTIPENTTLELLPGAVLFTSGSISLHADRARLLGHLSGIGSVSQEVFPNIVWTGADNSLIVKVATEYGVSCTGIRVEGICINGNGIAAGNTALRVGIDAPMGGGTAYSTIARVCFVNVTNGMDVFLSPQQMQYREIYGRNTAWGVSAGFGVRVNGGGTTTNWFHGGTIEGFQTAVLAGDVGPASLISFRSFVIQVGEVDGAVGFDIRQGGPWIIDDCFIEGQAAYATTGIRVGSASKFAELVNISSNTLQGCMTALIEGIGWKNLHIYHNYLDGSAAGFKNTGGGSVRFGGRWLHNKVATAGLTTEMTATTGFEEYTTENIDSSSAAPHLTHTSPPLPYNTALRSRKSTGASSESELLKLSLDTLLDIGNTETRWRHRMPTGALAPFWFESKTLSHIASAQFYGEPGYPGLTFTPNLDNGCVQRIGMIGNITTVNVPVSTGTILAGTRLVLQFFQDGTGGRTVGGWNAGYKQAWSDTGNVANAQTSIAFVYNGTNWQQDGAQSPYI